MIRRALLAAALASTASGFTVPASSAATRGGRGLAAFDDRFAEVEGFDPLNLSSSDESSANGQSRTASAIAAATAILAASPLSASAAGPDWGVFEGRTGSLLHPLAMFSMAAMSASTALLGFQWRRQRTLGDEISALKKTLPNLNGASSVKEAIAAAESAEEVDASYVSALKGALATEGQIEELTRERKELAASGPRDKHFNQGSLLLFVGIAFAIEVRSFCELSYF